jgi:stage V sporulation protein B
VLYPAALISSFSGLLVPEIAECNVQSSRVRIRYMISRVWSLALIFSIGTAGILLCFSGEIGQALYPGTETAKYIRLLAPLIPIMYIDTATDAILKGLGEQVYSMNINILDALISVILVWWLIPIYGVGGYIMTVYFSETFNTVFSIARLLKISRVRVRVVKWVAKPLLSVVGATTITHILIQATHLQISQTALSIIVHILLATGLYLVLLRLLGGIEREDVAWVSTLFRGERLQK